MLILSKKFIVLLTFCMASIGLSSPAKFRPGCGQTRSHLLVTYGNFPSNVEKYLICALFWNCIELSGSERLAHIFTRIYRIQDNFIFYYSLTIQIFKKPTSLWSRKNMRRRKHCEFRHSEALLLAVGQIWNKKGFCIEPPSCYIMDSIKTCTRRLLLLRKEFPWTGWFSCETIECSPSCLGACLRWEYDWFWMNRRRLIEIGFERCKMKKDAFVRP